MRPHPIHYHNAQRVLGVPIQEVARRQQLFVCYVADRMKGLGLVAEPLANRRCVKRFADR